MVLNHDKWHAPVTAQRVRVREERDEERGEDGGREVNTLELAQLCLDEVKGTRF